MRLIPLNFYFSFYLNFVHPPTCLRQAFLHDISNLLAFILLSLQGSEKRCWLLLLEFKIYTRFFFYIYIYFFLNFILRIGT